MNPLAWAYEQWSGIPAPIREPVRSFIVSVALGLPGVIGTAYSAYFFNPELHGQTWGGFFHLLVSPAFIGAAATAIAGVYRARQGFKAATQTVETSSAVSVPKPPPPATIVAVESVVAPGDAKAGGTGRAN